MTSISYFVAHDTDLTFNLQKSFHDYVALYTKLHFPESKNALSNAERRELILKLQDLVNEMSIMFMKMRRFKTDTEIVKRKNHQTISSSKRSNRLSNSEIMPAYI